MNQEAGPHETPIWQHLYVGLSSLQKVRNNCLLFKTPVYSIFVIAAPKALRQAVYYLDCGGDFMGIYICQIHQNWYMKYAQLIACQLYCNEAVQKKLKCHYLAVSWEIWKMNAQCSVGQCVVGPIPHSLSVPVPLPCNFAAPFQCGWAPVPSLDRKHMAPPYGWHLAGACWQMWSYHDRLCTEAASCISTIAVRTCPDWPSAELV